MGCCLMLRSIASFLGLGVELPRDEEFETLSASSNGVEEGAGLKKKVCVLP